MSSTFLIEITSYLPVTDWNIESIRWRVSICWLTETPACSPADQADIQMTRWVCLTYLAFYSLNAAGMNVENVVGKLFIILRSCIISITTSQVNWVSYKDRNLTFTDHVGGGAMTGWRWDNIVKTVAALCSTALLLNKNNHANHHILSLSLSLPLFSLPADNNLDSSARPNMNIEVVTSPIFPGPSTYLTTPSRPPLWNLWWTAKCQWSKYEELESWPITRHHDMRQTIRQTESNSTRKRSIRLLTHHSQANTSCKTKSRKFEIQSFDFNVILA